MREAFTSLSFAQGNLTDGDATPSPSSNTSPIPPSLRNPSIKKLFDPTNKIPNSKSPLLPSSMDYQIKAGSEFRSGDHPVVEPPPARRWHIDGAGDLPPSRAMHLTGNLLRGAAALLTFVAAIVMGTAAQTKRVVVIDGNGSPVTLAGTAKSHYSSALVYFIVINVLTLVYSLATITLYYASKKAIMAGIYLPLTVTDLLTMIFLVSCNGAASAISVVAENGNRHFGWDKICASVGQYCAQVAIAIVLSMFATVAYVLLVLLTILALHKRL